MDKKTKQTMLVVAFGVILYAAVMHLDSVIAFLKNAGDMLLPVGIGLLTAFVLSVPVNGFEKLIGRIFSRAKHKPKGKGLRLFCLLLTLLCVVAVIVMLCTVVIPEVVKTLKGIVALIEKHWPEWIAALQDIGFDTAFIDKWQSELDLEKLVSQFGNNAKMVVGSIADAATSTVSALASLTFGIIIAIYVILDKETLARQSKKLLYANIKAKTVDRIIYVAGLIRDTYAKFLSGQCVEALILGAMIVVSFLIFRLPYAWLVGMVTAVCALIPYIGAFVSCALAVMLSFLVSPTKALVCVIVYLCVQFIENQFIYPHVVGGSVGLSPLWTLVAVLIGGKLFGLLGMIMFIPFIAVLYELVSERTNRKLENKNKASTAASGQNGGSINS